MLMAVATSIVLLAAERFTQRYIVEDEFVARLESFGFNGVIEGSPVSGPGKPTWLGHDTTWIVRVERVVHDRGPYRSLAVEGLVEQPLPVADSLIEVSVPIDEHLELGGVYAFVLVKGLPDGLAAEGRAWPWQTRLILDATSGYRAVPGTPEGMVDDLEWIVQAGESRLTALVAFLEEHARVLDARVLGQDEPSGPRLAILRQRTGGPPAVDPIADFVGRAPEMRQLPGLMADAPDGLDAALGLDRWTPWTVLILYDEDVSARYQWAGLFVDGYGVLGPILLAPAQRLTAIDGLGPASASVVPLAWDHGVPRLVASPVDDEIVDSMRLGPAVLMTARSDAGLFVLIDLREPGGAAVLITADEADALIMQMAGSAGAGEGSELSEG